MFKAIGMMFEFIYNLISSANNASIALNKTSEVLIEKATQFHEESKLEITKSQVKHQRNVTEAIDKADEADKASFKDLLDKTGTEANKGENKTPDSE